MFGRHKKNADGGAVPIAVDATLEGDIHRVEQSVAEYLGAPTGDPVNCSWWRWKDSMLRRTRATHTESR